MRRRSRVVILSVIAVAIAGFTSFSLGCGDDLVVGGMLIIRTPTSVSATATPDPDDDN